MESDAIYNSPEEVIVKDREKSIPRNFWNLILFSLNDSYFHPEKLKSLW